MDKILVIGGEGQLGKCLQLAAKNFPEAQFYFKDVARLDISSKDALEKDFKAEAYDYCINCAAYTNVEKAEEEEDKAYLINAYAVENLVAVCNAHHGVLIHISTDYVFDGEKKSPYTEDDDTYPINVYGASKLKGEQLIQEQSQAYFILRTSWLYSQFGNNFYKTILQKSAENIDLKITEEQTGTPTNANDLAHAILYLIKEKKQNYGIYHFSNNGQTTWYGFAQAILNLQQDSKCTLIASNAYKTKAARPKNSVLSKEKFKDVFEFSMVDWEKSLSKLYQENFLLK
ncbi:dTDP-4-dehydrorhamnose reductase [Mesonia ostreae]|uniref:dTDP-4-dehydrorhamnose reductase n=1 Tax=Mesonia ostreae TaxID=861110 RepID=A0ABU2KIX0_9FLAO|nr:dTDP-4-dehydrorhamnose reductase [Mesonia ostreae]MDT0294662.1 dTDP-4-dehydrorhamnose reductase [Mesonia ostreae]